MGPAIVLVAIAFFTLLLLVSALFLLWILRRFGLFRSRQFTIAALLAPLVLGGVWVMSIVYLYVGPSLQSKEQIFRSIFAKQPGEEFNILEGRAEGGTDFGEARVLFAYQTAESVASLIEELGLETPTSAPDMLYYDSDGPEWWRPQDCEGETIYSAYDVRRWDDVVLLDCRSTSSVYAIARWID